MTRIDRSDIPRLAEMLVTVGQRLGQTVVRNGIPMPGGEAAWFAAQEFEPGPRAATSDPGGGNRWETDDADEVHPVLSDPAGDAATSTDLTSLTFVRYRTLLGWLDDNAADLRNMLGSLLPPQPNTRVEACSTCGTPRPVLTKRRRDLVDADVTAAGYCQSCYRDDRYLESIQTNSAGQRYYKTMCRWCGAFKADYGIEPPLALVVLHHQYPRVSAAQVEAHLPKHLRGRASAKAG